MGRNQSYNGWDILKYLYIYIYIYKQKPQGGAATLGKKIPYNADAYTAFK